MSSPSIIFRLHHSREINSSNQQLLTTMSIASSVSKDASLDPTSCLPFEYLGLGNGCLYCHPFPKKLLPTTLALAAILLASTTAEGASADIGISFSDAMRRNELERHLSRVADARECSRNHV